MGTGDIAGMRDSYEDSPAGTREAGLRRLGRLTWRTTQLGALATVGFAIVFARTAEESGGTLTIGRSASGGGCVTLGFGPPAGLLPKRHHRRAGLLRR